MFRSFADRNRDGDITRAEAEQMAQLIAAQASESSGSALLVDGREPAISDVNVTSEGLVGPTSAEGPIHMRLTASLAWAGVAADADAYNLTASAEGARSSAGGRQSVTVHAPPGYQFTAVQGVTGAEPGASVVTGDVPDPSLVALTLGRMPEVDDAGPGAEGAGDADAPMPGAPLVALALGLAAVALRRRA